MLFALGAASSAIDALQSLTTSKPASPLAGGFSQDAASLFDSAGSSVASASSTATSGAGGCSQISPATMSALLAAQSQSSTGSTTQTSTSPSQALQDLFSQIDGNGDGQITRAEFEDALGAGGTNIAQADDVFAKLDKDGNGSISLSELSSALKGGHGHYHHGAGGSGASDPLAQALEGAASTPVSNSDGPTTTSLTYPDGSTVTMTSPAATTAPSTATSSYNFIEQMIAREAKAISFSAVPALSLSA